MQSENPPQSPGFELRASVDGPASLQQPRKWDRLRATQSTAADYRRTTGESSVIGLAQLQQVRDRGTRELDFKQVSPLAPAGLAHHRLAALQQPATTRAWPRRKCSHLDIATKPTPLTMAVMYTTARDMFHDDHELPSLHGFHN